MRSLVRIVLCAALVAAGAGMELAQGAPEAQALDDGLAAAPQMGWNEWNTFGCGVSDSLVREASDALVSSGMAAAGYEYVTIDDCWSTMSRDSAGDLVPDPAKFPHGMKDLADYVHAKGLKLGIYAEAGTTTCSGYPGSLGHETRDAALFASWGVDYVKYDNCGDHRGLTDQQRYTVMRDALAATGRPILFALCQWGGESVWTWGAGVGHSWRTTADIQPSWSSILGILDKQVGLEDYAGPGGWNDPDMLEVGNPALTDSEARAHFSLWALLNAPLLAGNDIRSMSASTLEILTNRAVIAVDQDWGGVQGRRIRDDGANEVWAKPMSDGSVAVVLLAREGAASVSVGVDELGLGAATSYRVSDLWTGDATTTSGSFTAQVPAHGAVMVRISGGGATPTTSRPTTTSPRPTTPTTTKVRTTKTTKARTTKTKTKTTKVRTKTRTTRTATTSAPAPSSESGTTSPPAEACTATAALTNAWSGGHQGEVTVTNSGGTAIAGWSVSWTVPGGSAVTAAWSGSLSETAHGVLVSDLGWNGPLGVGASTTFGFMATGEAAVPVPTCTPR